jgi:large subunit ribosomal protein L9
MLEMILTKDVDNLGRAGDLVRVKPGYGRNYLIPRGLALLATKANLTQLEHHRREIAATQARIHADNLAKAKQLQQAVVSIPRKVGKDDKMFGSVSSKDIAEALAAQNIQLDRRLIRLEDPIKTVGEHEVEIRFSAEVTVTIKVQVIAVGG